MTTGALRAKFTRWVVGVSAVALLIANTMNIASDLSGMAIASAHMLSWLYVAFGMGRRLLTWTPIGPRRRTS